MENLNNKNVILLAKMTLGLVMISSIIIEIIFFPSIPNLVGCIMMITSYVIFTKFFFKREVIIRAPFSFFMLLSMFFYRYLPLVATLLEGKPVSYGMQNPIKTFFLETLLFIVSCMAFYFSFKQVDRVNILQKILNTFGFYKKGNEKIFWILGLLGTISAMISFATGKIETGDVIGKLFKILHFYIYSPVILFFPCLYKSDCKENIDLKNKKVWLYLIFISVLNLASNSRGKIITPFAIIMLLLLLALAYKNINLEKLLKPSVIIRSLIAVVLVIATMSTVSKAILINRNIRDDVSFTQLIENTLETLVKQDIGEKWDDYNNKLKNYSNYEQGWTEDYIDNYILNRFCNIRITDETLYLGNRLSQFGHEQMFNDFKNRIISNIPQPLIEIIGMNINKENYYNSRGDRLYVYSGIGENTDLGGYRVTSHLGDGLSTFGISYFILQFIMWYFVMILLNSFSINTSKSGRIYSVFGLLSAYVCLLKFGNANGMIDDVLYFSRGYWQDVILFLIIYKCVRVLSLIRIK